MRPPGEVSGEVQVCDDLAAAHRLLAAFGMDEPGRGHLTASLGGGRNYACSAKDRMWAATTQWHLSRCPVDRPLNPVHAAVYAEVGSASAIVECHSAALEAVSCLEGGFAFLSASSAGLYGRIAYCDWLAEEGDVRSVRDLKSPPAVLMLRGRGAMAIGTSVAEAFLAMYDLHRACTLQLKLLSTGLPVHRPSQQTLEQLAEQHRQDASLTTESRWKALRDWLGAVEVGDMPQIYRSNLS